MYRRNKVVEIYTKIKGNEVRDGIVTKFGTSGAHIVFTKEHIGKKVVIITLEK